MKHCHVTRTTGASRGLLRRNAVPWLAAVAFSFLMFPPHAGAGLVLDDPLQGSTTGTRSGGVFVAGGWKVTGAYDCIYWHVPTTSKGAVEWDVRGLQPGECRTGMEDKIEIFHMYDYTFGNSDDNYNGGYRDNPYKHFVRKIGCVGGTVDAMELVWKIGDEYVEPDTPVLSWSPTVTYRFREEWEPEGESSRLRTYRDGVLVMSVTLPGLYAPAGLSIRIAASTRRDAAAGAPIDAVYSNVKVWDLSASALAAPVIADVSPDPDLASPGLEYARELALEQGNPAPAWAILAGPPGLRVDSSGRLSGWVPAAADLGSQFEMEVRATNSQGSDVESWFVEVAEARAVSFPFDRDAEGWTLSVWQSGPYNPGTIAWESSGGHPGGGIRAGGAGDSNNQDTCTREGGTMTRVISTAGLRSVRVDYDVRASLGAPPGGSAGGNCTVLEGSSEDKLVAYYSTRGVNGPWARADLILEPELPGAWGHRTVNLSSISAAGDNPAFALKFQWQFNARDDAGSIDNVRVQGAVIRLETKFQRGDPNADGRGDISDAVSVLGFLFLGAGSLPCEQSGDANDDGALDISDAVYILSFLFLGGDAIEPPAGACGVDPTGHDLPCESFPGCE
jgi:hypothetical protein